MRLLSAYRQQLLLLLQKEELYMTFTKRNIALAIAFILAISSAISVCTSYYYTKDIRVLFRISLPILLIVIVFILWKNSKK
ncbi:MAG: hypothetical protein K1X55_10185 [Chitinophagales bacterium]|nr:hypothetical protein [Chitinophagales bacterium]